MTPAEKLREEFTQQGSWGLSAAIDLSGCNHESITSVEVIRRYVREAVERIQSRAYGECIIENFGLREEVKGYSVVQLIETSLISGHFVNLTDSAYIDVFSCSFFDPFDVAVFSRDFFQAETYHINCLLRR